MGGGGGYRGCRLACRDGRRRVAVIRVSVLPVFYTAACKFTRMSLVGGEFCPAVTTAHDRKIPRTAEPRMSHPQTCGTEHKCLRSQDLCRAVTQQIPMYRSWMSKRCAIFGRVSVGWVGFHRLATGARWIRHASRCSLSQCKPDRWCKPLPRYHAVSLPVLTCPDSCIVPLFCPAYPAYSLTLHICLSGCGKHPWLAHVTCRNVCWPIAFYFVSTRRRSLSRYD